MTLDRPAPRVSRRVVAQRIKIRREHIESRSAVFQVLSLE